MIYIAYIRFLHKKTLSENTESLSENTESLSENTESLSENTESLSENRWSLSDFLKNKQKIFILQWIERYL